MSKKITIVTVCYQAEATIKDTVDSVINQTYNNIEYIIMDGKSEDRTMDILEQYKNSSFIKIFSEKDNGLYHAMNKAIDIATGDYIIFMNSGDLFYNTEVLSKIVSQLDKEIVYGSVIRKKGGQEIHERYTGKCIELRLLIQGRMMSHQSIFTKLSIMKQYKFDETFKITADYNFIAKALHNNVSMKYVDIPVSIVDNEEGISSNIANMDKMRAEDDRSLKENFPIIYEVLRPIKGIVRFIKRRMEVKKNE